MPSVSQAQNRFMHAHADDQDELGQVAKEFVQADAGRKVGKLPDHVTPKRRAVAQAMMGR